METKKVYKVKPKQRQLRAIAIASENGGNVSKAMREAGYAPATAHNPEKLTTTPAWKDLMEKHLPDSLIGETHESLMKSQTMDHMVFPLGPVEQDDKNFSGGKNKKNKTADDDAQPEAVMPEEHKERTTLTDKEIIEMLLEVNCTVRRIVHGETSRHVYFWSPDNNARKNALELAYKIKGRFAPEKHVVAVFSLNDLLKRAEEKEKTDDE